MHAYKFIDLTNSPPFGRLTVLSRAPNKKGKTAWLCQCICGNTIGVQSISLRTGNTRSCGCLKIENHTIRNYKHGMAITGERHPLYGLWADIIQRCTNARNPGFMNYGGRGITVCDRWQRSFPDFLTDMGERPSPKHSIERRSNSGNYEPQNCYWATWKEQMNNTRRTIWITYHDETLTLPQWAARQGMPQSRLWARIFLRGWTIEQAMSAPFYSHRRSLSERS